MKITAHTARLITRIALFYMVVLGLATVLVVGPGHPVAIHYDFALQPNYGLPALLAVAILPLLTLVIVRWLVRPRPDGVLDDENRGTLILTLVITSAAQTFICLMALI